MTWALDYRKLASDGDGRGKSTLGQRAVFLLASDTETGLCLCVAELDRHEESLLISFN